MAEPGLETQYSGGYFCNNIPYPILSHPDWGGQGHCNICRRTSGAAFASWAYF